VITAHLPSGYIVGRTWPKDSAVLAAAVLGGVFPDLDLIWFYLVDGRSIHHHRYWVHAPFFWLVIGSLALTITKVVIPKYLNAAGAFLAAIFVHLILDTLAGDIMWRWPFSSEFTHLISVEPKYENWILNFIFHPVFMIEICIWILAAFLFIRPPHAD